MRKVFFYAMCLLLGTSLCLKAELQSSVAKDGTIEIKAKRITVTVKEGRIIGIRTKKTVISSPATQARAVVSGVGSMTGRGNELSKVHFPWGDPRVNHAVPANIKTRIYHFPDSRSKLITEKKGGAFIASWTGLGDSVEFFPDDKVIISFEEDRNGALAMTAKGYSASKGVFGIAVPLENINGQGRFILPSFGGLEHDACGEPGIISLQDSGTFYEAKIMTYELGDSALGFWYQDDTFRPYFTFFGRGKENSWFAMELNTLLPYDDTTEVKTPPFFLDAFDDAGWLAAATPYRNWYQARFANEIAKRDAIPWANKINAIADGKLSEASAKRIKELMPPECVLLHTWQARKLGFTAGVPDYTLRDEYPGEVALAHKHGFKMMCYVCALCAEYQSKAWKADNVGDFFLTRKLNINSYKGQKSAADENMVGTLNAAQGKDQFANIKPGKLIYGDPLSPGWRKYIVGKVKEVNTSSGTDANYQDTLGCTSENGNGYVDGLSGAQGNCTLAKAFLEAMPNTPMASEYGPEPIAHTVKWPLNYAQFWAWRPFRKWRIHRQHPMTAYLYGYRPWIPVINTGDAFHKHLVSAVSDATNGMGMFSPSGDIDIRNGFADHLTLRSSIFTTRHLVPYFPKDRYPAGVRSMYQDDKGGLYRYCDDGRLQQMLDANGKPLYGRVDCASSVKAPGLYLPGWPCQDEDGIYGLNPDENYALFPRGKDEIRATVSFGKVPENVTLRFFYERKGCYIYAEFTGKGTMDLSYKCPAEYAVSYVNDKPSPLGKISGELPLRVLLLPAKSQSASPQVLCINQGSGLQQGAALGLPALRKVIGGINHFHIHGFGFKSIDTVFDVTTDDAAIVFTFKNDQAKYGNGTKLTALVNGKEIKSFDCYDEKAKKFDLKFRRWRIPVGQFKGQRILFSQRVDYKGGSNSDMQWVSLPKMVNDKKQAFTEEFPPETSSSPSDKADKARPQAQIIDTKTPTWKTPQVKETAPGTFVFKTATAHASVISAEKIRFEEGRKYYISGEFRKPEGGKASVYFGIVQFKANGGPIQGTDINRVPGTLIKLSRPAEVGDTKLWTFDASQWICNKLVGVGEQLPAQSIIGKAINIEQYGGDWGIFLDKPLKKALPAGTFLALYSTMATHFYTDSGAKPGADFKELGGQLRRWPGAVSFSIFILSKDPLEFRNLKVDVY
ncbi:MAG: hypothetical protein IKS20_04770 [Victivallales bacterium]|nr:hypothetical protein [Victivallales bacterium]